MSRKNTIGQNVTEYLLVFSAVVVVLIIALRPGGPVTEYLNQSMDKAFDSLDDISKKECLGTQDKKDGKWGSWGAWSACTLCEQKRMRTCSDPKCGGSECQREKPDESYTSESNRVEWQTQACMINEDDFYPTNWIQNCGSCVGPCGSVDGNMDCVVFCDGCCNPAKPPATQSCVKPAYTGNWETGDWACQSVCGTGLDVRDVWCTDPLGCCNPGTKPPATQPCTNGCCPITKVVGYDDRVPAADIIAAFPKASDGQTVSLNSIGWFCPPGYSGNPTMTCERTDTVNGPVSKFTEEVSDKCVPADCRVDSSLYDVGYGLQASFPAVTLHKEIATINCDNPSYNQADGITGYTGQATLECQYGDWVDSTLVAGCIPNCAAGPMDVGDDQSGLFPETDHNAIGSAACPCSHEGGPQRMCTAGVWGDLIPGTECTLRYCPAQSFEVTVDDGGRSVGAAFPQTDHNQSAALDCQTQIDSRFEGKARMDCDYCQSTGWTNPQYNCTPRGCGDWTNVNIGGTVTGTFMGDSHGVTKDLNCTSINQYYKGMASSKCCYGDWYAASTDCASVMAPSGTNAYSGGCEEFACTTADLTPPVANAAMCGGDDTLLTADVPWSVVDNTSVGGTGCTDATKCEYVCDSTPLHEKSGNTCIPARCLEKDVNIGSGLITKLPESPHTTVLPFADCSAVDSHYEGSASAECDYGTWIVTAGCTKKCPEQLNVDIGAGALVDVPETVNGGSVSFTCADSNDAGDECTGARKYSGTVTWTCNLGTWSTAGVCDYQSCAAELLCAPNKPILCGTFSAADHDPTPPTETLTCNALDGNKGRYAGNFSATCNYGKWCNLSSDCAENSCVNWAPTINGVSVTFAGTGHGNTAAGTWVDTTYTTCDAQSECCYGTWIDPNLDCAGGEPQGYSGTCRVYACVNPISPAPANAAKCSSTSDLSDETNLTADTSWTIVNSPAVGGPGCTLSQKCEHVCDSFPTALYEKSPDGKTCVAAKCPALETNVSTDLNAQITGRFPPLPLVSGESGTTYTLTCSAVSNNYTGTASAACNAGLWGPVDLSQGCTPNGCSAEPGPYTNADITGSGLKHGDTRTVTCKAGYAGSPNSTTVTCDFGTWTGSGPACTATGCSDLTTDIGATGVTLSGTFPAGTASGVTVTLDCTGPPYTEGTACSQKRYVGSVSRTCNAGTWGSQTGPGCSYKSCLDEQFCDPNGNAGLCYTFPASPHTTTPTTKNCTEIDNRYTGSFEVTCNYGKWCGLTGGCTAKNCSVSGLLNIGASLTGTFWATDHNTYGYSSCPANYYSASNPHRLCSYGTWGTDLYDGCRPDCLREWKLNSTYSTYAWFEQRHDGEDYYPGCPSGYTGTPYRTCNFGVWGSLQGDCTPNSCVDEYKDIGSNQSDWFYAQTSGSSRTVTCPFGYQGYPTKTSGATRTCSLGVWGDLSNWCVPADCTCPCGTVIASGTSCGTSCGVSYYCASSVTCGNTCSSVSLTCTNGSLSNSTCTYTSCTVDCCPVDGTWGAPWTDVGSCTACYQQQQGTCSATCEGSCPADPINGITASGVRDVACDGFCCGNGCDAAGKGETCLNCSADCGTCCVPKTCTDLGLCSGSTPTSDRCSGTINCGAAMLLKWKDLGLLCSGKYCGYAFGNGTCGSGAYQYPWDDRSAPYSPHGNSCTVEGNTCGRALYANYPANVYETYTFQCVKTCDTSSWK